MRTPVLAAETVGDALAAAAGVEMASNEDRVGVEALALFEPVCNEDTARELPLFWVPSEPRRTSAIRISRSDC